MKKNIITLFVLSLVFISCSHDNPSTPASDPNDLIPTTYFPLKSSNNWHYDVSSSGTVSNDILSVGVDNLIGTNTYKKMIGTDANDVSLPANGSLCNLLNNNNLRIDGSSLKLTGTLNYAVLTNPITINVTDFVLLKQNATSGDLSSQTGTINETFNNNGTVYPLTIKYTLTSTSLGNLSSYNSNAVTYNDIKKVKLTLSVTVTSPQNLGGVSISVPIMNTQDIFTSTLYFCNGKGIVYNNTLINWDLDPRAATFGVPSNLMHFNATQEDFLTTYTLN